MSSNWFVLGKSEILKKTNPKRVWFDGNPIVLFRNQKGVLNALLDRCPHRGAPLSKGDVHNDCIRCPYHGWQFNGDGDCQNIPGNQSEICNTFHVKSYRCKEDQGLIWIQTNKSDHLPYQIPGWGQHGFKMFSWTINIKTSLESAAENFLDATHTHYVHSGLIRTEGKRKEVQVSVRSIDNGIEAEYNEGRQSGWIMKLLSGGAKEISSFGRFILPGIAQLEYRTDRGRLAYMTAFLTPTKDGFIQAHLVFTYKWGFVARWLNWMFKPLFWIALKQDLKILKLQSENLHETNDCTFISTPLDLLGPKIKLLIKSAQLGQKHPQWKEYKTKIYL